MKCPACYSEIDDRSYRCTACRRSLRIGALLAISLHRFAVGRADRILDDPRVGQPVVHPGYDKLPPGALVSDATTMGWLGLTDKGWFARSRITRATCCICGTGFSGQGRDRFRSWFIGDYVNTWGKPKVLLEDPRFNRNYDFVFYGFKTALLATCPLSMRKRRGSIAR